MYWQGFFSNRLRMQFAKLTCLLLLVLTAVSVHGQLVRVGPVDRNNGFPAWYQDSTGLVLDACLPNAQELTDGSCLVDATQLTSPGSPISFPNNFPDEFFFWNGTANLTVNGGRALLVMGLEGAFANGGVVAGDQMVFSRLRIRVDIPAPGGTYRVIHPFGVEEFPDLSPGIKSINLTTDVGTVAGDFGIALNGRISAFLRAATSAGGPALAPVVLPGGHTFLTDPAVTTAVTGSPFGTNVFRIEGPNIGGPGIDFIETDQFTLMGRVHLAPIPSPVAVTRATYRRDGYSAQADVFATATPAIGVPNPVLSITGTHVLGTVMENSGDKFFAQPVLQNPHSIPASLLVTNSSDSPVTFTETDLVDEVQITSAVYDPATHMLTVHATSADQLMPPTLIVTGLGQLDGMGELNIHLPVPLSEVTVISSWGGRDTRKVSIASIVRNGNVPFAANDELGDLAADQPVTINILSNDTPNSGVMPRILAQPLHGAAVVNANGTVTYTPSLAFAGPDSFSYLNTDGNSVDSNVATVSFTVAFVNHAPIAQPDSATASVTTPVIIDVLANDSDLDAGDTLDPQSVSIVIPPASGLATPNANGTITFLPSVGGTVTFSYTVKDSHGAVSNPASVTVSVLSPDVITVAQAQFRTRGDWRVRGTTTIAGPGNTITIHIGPTLNGPVLGTVAVDATGAWDFPLKGTNIRPDATNTVSLESTKGGRRLAVPLQITN